MCIDFAPTYLYALSVLLFDYCTLNLLALVTMPTTPLTNIPPDLFRIHLPPFRFPTSVSSQLPAVTIASHMTPRTPFVVVT